MRQRQYFAIAGVFLALVIVILIGASHAFAKNTTYPAYVTLPKGMINPVSVQFVCVNTVLGKYYAHFTWTNDTNSEFIYTNATDYFTPSGVVSGTPPYAFPVDNNTPQNVVFGYNGTSFTWVVGNSQASTGAKFCPGS